MTSNTKQDFLASLERTHGRQLRRYFAARLRNAAADASDLSQEVYLRLLRIERVDTIKNPQAYLFTVASHVLHQHGLRQAVTAEIIEVMDGLAEVRSLSDTDPSTLIELEQRFEALGHALLQHSPKAYATLLLHRCDGVPLQEIATQFGISYAMVKRYLSKALTFCQQLLDASEQADS